MSIDVNWPAFPKTINEKVWQKKKGIVAVKKTGISEAIAEAESAFEGLTPGYYSRISLNLDTKEGAERADKSIFNDSKNIKAFVLSMGKFATTCEKKAAEFKASKFIPKAVGEFLTDMASDARKLGEEVKAHVAKAQEEVEEIKNSFAEDGNIVKAKSCIADVYKLIDDWDKAYPGQMRLLETMNKDLVVLNKEMDGRLEGTIDKPASDLKSAFLDARDGSQGIQDVMLGKKAYGILRSIKEIRGLIKVIKNDKTFAKEVVDPFERRANKFLDQRETLNVLSSNIIGDAGAGYSLLQEGLKSEDAVMTEVEKFAEIFYDESSPNSVEKAQEQVQDLDGYIRQIIPALKQDPLPLEDLRRMKQKSEDLQVKLDNSIFALGGAIKTSSRLTRGRFKNHPMIGGTLKRMAGDVVNLQKEIKKVKEVYAKVALVMNKVL